MALGIVVRQDGLNEWAWAWTGVRVEAAVDLSAIDAFSAMPEAERLRAALRAQADFLQGQLGASATHGIELRILRDPAKEWLSVSLLGVVMARGAERAASDAASLRDRLMVLPSHVVGRPIIDDDELLAVLCPFTPAADGMARIEKRRLYGTPQRPDAGVPYYFAVQPFTVASRSWDQFLSSLSTHPAPVAYTVGLQATTMDLAFGNTLEVNATHYSRLAQDGETEGGLYHGKAKLTADAFCIDAKELYTDALRRYRGHVFKSRIQLASPVTLPDGLVQLAGATISPNDADESNYVLRETVGTPYRVERPRSNAEAETFGLEFETLAHLAQVNDPPVNGYAAPPSEALRLLCSIVDAREAAAAFRLPIAPTGHLPGIAVRHPSMYSASDYVPSGPHIDLGDQLVGGQSLGTTSVELADLSAHALFVGAAGSGKTSTLLNVLGQLWLDHHVPFLVIEPVNWDADDYRWFLDRPGFESMVVFTVGDEHTAPFRLNPFQIEHGVIVADHIAALRRCFVSAFGLWDPLPAIYNEALLETYVSRGILPADRACAEHDGRWPTLREFRLAMDRVVENPEIFNYAGEVRSNLLAASQIRVRQLANGPSADMLETRVSSPIEEVLRRPVVIELGRIGGDTKEQALAISLLFTAIAQHVKQRPQMGTLVHLTVIEEAHRLLAQSGPQSGEHLQGDASSQASEMFEQILAENRKYGAGVAIVEQDPAKLVTGSYKNTFLKVMHRLPAAGDRDLIGATMNLTDDQRRFAATLVAHEALVFHSELGRAAHVRVPNIRAIANGDGARRPLPGDAQIAERFEALLAEAPDFAEAMRPFDECSGCRHVCDFRGTARAMAGRSSGRERFRAHLAALSAPAGTVDEWWDDLLELLDEIGGIRATETSALADQRACTMLHFLRGAYKTYKATWPDRVRARSLGVRAN